MTGGVREWLETVLSVGGGDASRFLTQERRGRSPVPPFLLASAITAAFEDASVMREWSKKENLGFLKSALEKSEDADAAEQQDGCSLSCGKLMSIYFCLCTAHLWAY